MRLRKSGMARLRRFRHETGVEPTQKRWRKPLLQIVLSEDTFRVCDRGGIGQRGSRRERSFLSSRNIGNGERNFWGPPCGNSEAAAFDGRKMAAHGVHRGDGSPTGDKRAMNRLNVLESHVRIERKYKQRGATAGKKKEDQCAFIAEVKQAQDSFAGAPAVDIRNRMATEEILKIRQDSWRIGWCDHDTRGRDSIRENSSQAGDHGMSCFTDGDNQHAGKTRTI